VPEEFYYQHSRAGNLEFTDIKILDEAQMINLPKLMVV